VTDGKPLNETHALFTEPKVKMFFKMKKAENLYQLDCPEHYNVLIQHSFLFLCPVILL